MLKVPRRARAAIRRCDERVAAEGMTPPGPTSARNHPSVGPGIRRSPDDLEGAVPYRRRRPHHLDERFAEMYANPFSTFTVVLADHQSRVRAATRRPRFAAADVTDDLHRTQPRTPFAALQRALRH